MKIDPSDWKRPGVDQIVENTLRAAEEGKGNIILLHDGGGDRGETVEALPKIIDALRALGFTFVPLSTLVSLTPDRLMPSVTGIDASLRWSDHFFFSAVFIIGWCVYSIFLFGLILGLFRFGLVLTFALIHKFRKEKSSDRIFTPSVSVIIPAYNEA